MKANRRVKRRGKEGGRRLSDQRGWTIPGLLSREQKVIRRHGRAIVPENRRDGSGLWWERDSIQSGDRICHGGDADEHRGE